MMIDVLQTKHYFAVCFFFNQFLLVNTTIKTIPTETIQVTNSLVRQCMTRGSVEGDNNMNIR